MAPICISISLFGEPTTLVAMPSQRSLTGQSGRFSGAWQAYRGHRHPFATPPPPPWLGLTAHSQPRVSLRALWATSKRCRMAALNKTEAGPPHADEQQERAVKRGRKQSTAVIVIDAGRRKSSVRLSPSPPHYCWRGKEMEVEEGPQT